MSIYAYTYRYLLVCAIINYFYRTNVIIYFESLEALLAFIYFSDLLTYTRCDSYAFPTLHHKLESACQKRKE